MTTWLAFNALSLPPDDWVLVCVLPEDHDCGAQPYITIGGYDRFNGAWRNRYERIRGTVTHWMPLPSLPEIAEPFTREDWERLVKESRGTTTVYEQVSMDEAWR